MLLVSACFGSGDPDAGQVEAPGVKPAVMPLSTAQELPWVQRVWYTGQAGEKVEGLTLTAGADARPVVTFVTPIGARRTVRLDAPGVAVPLDHRVAGESRASTTARTPDGRLRVRVEDDGGPALIGTPMEGGAPVVWVRDAAGTLLRHPSFGADGAALYFDEGSARGGIYRFDVRAPGLARVVPESGAATPVAWPSEAGGERIVYVEESADAPPRVLVASPAAGEIVAPHQVLDAGVPGSLIGISVDPTGRWVRVLDCDGDGPEASLQVVEAGAVSSLLPDVRLTGAWSCGEGCWEWAHLRESGALQVAMRWTRAEDQTWRLDLLGGAPGVIASAWIEAAKADEVVDLPGCAPKLADDAWLVTTRELGQDHFAYDDLVASGDRLNIAGTRRNGRQPFVLVLPHGDRSTRYQNTVKHEPADRRVAVHPDGSVVEVFDGALIWKRGEARDVLLPASPDRKITGVGWSPAGDRLVFGDAGASAGVWEIDLGAREAVRRVAVEQPGAVAAYDWQDQPWVAWVTRLGGRAAIQAGRPLSEAERAAWARGPLTLLDLRPRWSPVQLDGGRLMQCTGAPVVELKVDRDGVRLQWGERVAVPVWTSLTDRDDAVSFLATDAKGAPVVVAELRADEELGRQGHQAWQWLDRTGQVTLPASAWLPADLAAELPPGTACREH